MGGFVVLWSHTKQSYMAVQQEIKSQLAKLLATEDLVVEHKHVTSAQFNVHTRVLILPLWEKASHDVYDMLVGHEVGHALFTPDEDPPADIPHQFVNVVEDARIEKLMKRKYMGLAKTFFNGYKELHKDDFFELDGEDISSFNLADRANLYFKVGHFLDLAFFPAEKEIIDMIGRCETFADTKKAAFVLYQYCLEQEKKEEEREKSHNHSSNVKLEETETSPDHDWYDEEDELEEEEEDVNKDPEVKTADTLENKLQELVNVGGVENVYIEVPKVDLDSVIATNSEVHSEVDNCFAFQQKGYDDRADEVGLKSIDIFEESDKTFWEFKEKAQKEVNYLVKEFECKKAATAYSRATVSKTGILDTVNLHEYKFSEDLFKKVTILPDGKSHGLVFILDWSGSMQYVMQDTLKQLYNLIWFCKKVHLPFEVYAFTQEWNRHIKDYVTGEHLPTKIQIHYEKKEGFLKIEDDFNLLNIFTSKVNIKLLQKQMLNIWRLAHCFREPTYYTYPQRLVLSGTPLNESLISLHQIIPQFKKDTRVEKVQCIILTDGEANPLPYHKTVQRNWESLPYLGCRNINPGRCFLRDRKVGKVYKFEEPWHQFTNTLLVNLKDNFPFVNFIGIRVVASRDANQFIKIHYWNDLKGYERVFKEWKKYKSCNITNSGYDAYFGMLSTNLSQDSEFDVDEDATKAQIKRAFVKSLKVKKLNKNVLNQFISLVA